MSENRKWRRRNLTWILIKEAEGWSWECGQAWLKEDAISDKLEAWTRAGMKGRIHESVNGWRDFGQAPFHYSRDEHKARVHKGLLVYVGAHMLVFIMTMSFGRLPACHLCITVCVCVPLCVCFWGLCVHSVLGWVSTADLAAACSKRIREVAPLKWSWSICERVRVFVLLCGCIDNESAESCVCRESERELDQITGKSWHQINSGPHNRGKKWRKGKEESCSLKEGVSMRGRKSEVYCRIWLCNNCRDNVTMRLWSCCVCSTLKQLFIFRLWDLCVLYKKTRVRVQPLFHDSDVSVAVFKFKATYT